MIIGTDKNDNYRYFISIIYYSSNKEILRIKHNNN